MSLYSALTQVLAPFAAKIKGIQTGYDGTEYNSPGEAVREQINDLHVLIGDTPGAAIQASAVAYGNSNVAAELTDVNGRLTTQEEIVERLNEGGLDIKDDVIEAQITDWLNDHPEATTTVLDGAISEAKLASALKKKVINNYVTPEMYGAVGDGVADDTSAIRQAIASRKPVKFTGSIYGITEPIEISVKRVVLFGDSNRFSIIKWIGSAENADYMIKIMSTAEYTAIMNLAFTGNNAASGIEDGADVMGLGVSVKTYISNVSLLSVENGLRIKAMGSVFESLYINGFSANSGSGLLIENTGTDSIINNVRVVNFLDGVVVEGSSTIMDNVKSCVNRGRGFYIKNGKGHQLRINAQENIMDGVELYRVRGSHIDVISEGNNVVRGDSSDRANNLALAQYFGVKISDCKELVLTGSINPFTHFINKYSVEKGAIHIDTSYRVTAVFSRFILDTADEQYFTDVEADSMDTNDICINGKHYVSPTQTVTIKQLYDSITA